MQVITIYRFAPEEYDAGAIFHVGAPVYAGVDRRMTSAPWRASSEIFGVCTHVPTEAEPWLSVTKKGKP